MLPFVRFFDTEFAIEGFASTIVTEFYCTLKSSMARSEQPFLEYTFPRWTWVKA